MELYIPNLTYHKTLKTCNEMLKKKKTIIYNLFYHNKNTAQ